MFFAKFNCSSSRTLSNRNIMWTSYKRLFNDINVYSIVCKAYKSHYEALNISKNATHKEIKDAYYRLSMIYHPDKNKSEEAAKMFRDITTAYDILGNIRQRKLYDSGADPNRKTSQYNPFETPNSQSDVHKTNVQSKDHSFDDFSRTQYKNIYQKQKLHREKVMYQKFNEQNVQRQHTYNYFMIKIFVSAFCLFSMFNYINKFISEFEEIEKIPEKNTAID